MPSVQERGGSEGGEAERDVEGPSRRTAADERGSRLRPAELADPRADHALALRPAALDQRHHVRRLSERGLRRAGARRAPGQGRIR